MDSSKDTAVDNLKITTCEMHTYGTPIKIVEDGVPDIPGRTILDKMNNLENKFSHIIKFMSYEPRGHHAVSVLRVKPDNPKADVAILFYEKEGCLTMCGEATLAFGRYCIDNGLVKPTEPETSIAIQCPCGLVPISVKYKNGISGNATLRSVPSFVFGTDIEINLDEIGVINVDVAFGGGFYAIVSAEDIGVNFCDIKSLRLASRIGHMLNEAIVKKVKLSHPDNDGLALFIGTLIVDTSDLSTNRVVKQMPVFRDSEGRGPCGSGTSAHIVTLLAKEKLALGESVVFNSAMSGVGFTAKVIEETKCGKHRAFTVEISGKGHYIGKQVMTLEQDDALKRGFIGIS
ncbi:trans-L-3-hydroxyproline dehydratase-like isoform X1 [Styela clava]